MAYAGKHVTVQVSADDSVYNPIAEINEVTPSFSGDNIDVTTFGDDFINRIQGLKDGTWSLSGFWAPNDTNGQILIRDAWLNDTDLYIQVFPTPELGFQQKVKVSSFEISAAVDGAVEVSIELEGDGAISAVEP